MCVNNNRPVAQQTATPPPCEQQRVSSPENQFAQQLQQDQCQCSPAVQKQALAQQKIDAKENSIRTLENNDSCGLSREQMVQALNGAGIGGGALNKASDQEVKTAYDKMHAAAQQPGHHAFKVELGGKKFKVGMNVASDGHITDLHAKKVKHHSGGFFGAVGDFLKGGLNIGEKVLGGALDIGKNVLGSLPIVGGLFGGGGSGSGLPGLPF